MAKRIAVIDIGSNSARLVIFQKTSRYGFHLLLRHKGHVRIGEGAYHRGGHLQPEPMERAYQTLESFSTITKAYRVKKIICVATSALRDAPNRDEFIERVRRKLSIDVRVISGQEEAKLGAISAMNLLPLRDGITVDIGGGSTDMARIEKGRIVAVCSLDLGTVRLKELFAQKRLDIQEARRYIHRALERIPDAFRSDFVVGIGGTARALAKGIMKQTDYPLEKIHGFEYDLKDQIDYFESIVGAKTDALSNLSIQKERFDTIREGTLIWLEVLAYLSAQHVTISGVGVREGAYLHDRLRKEGDRFPAGINPSIQSIKDRFDLPNLPAGSRRQNLRMLFKLFSEKFDGDQNDLRLLERTLDLSQVGKMLTIYKEHQHAFYIAKHELNYGFHHGEMLLIALILRSKGKKYNRNLYRQYQALLPKKKKIQWMVFLYTLVSILYEYAPNARMNFEYRDGILYIHGDFAPYLARQEIEQTDKPKEINRIEIS